MEDYKQYRISLAAARVNANMTQVEVTKRIGVSLKTLQNYENGLTIPTWDIMIQFSNLYQIPVGMFKLPTKL